MATIYQKIIPGCFAHICNRAVGNELLFRGGEDYEFFLAKLEKYIIPVAEIHSFCLLQNHYHLQIRAAETTEHALFSNRISRLESTYAKYFNKKYNRRGCLIMRPFQRVPTLATAHLIWIFWYIHRNPMHHGYTQNWQDWKYSSYPQYMNEQPGFLTTDFMLDLFGGMEYMAWHHQLHSDAFRLDFRQFGLE